MIDSNCLNKTWLDIKQAELNSDPILIEKVIRALYLLEQLAVSGLQFIFKGGTSLLLLLSEPHRFSIDIDILTMEDQSKLNSVFQNIVGEGHFINYTEDSRGKLHEIPKAHFKFFYTSVLNSHFPSYILLDILYESNPYPEIIKVPIQSDFILIKDTPLEVSVPSINSILGDKLTAYAPNTTGILYGLTKELEIIKQLYDVSRLFDAFNDISMVKASFDITVKKEIVYRRAMKLSPSDVLDDIFQTSYIIASKGIESPDDYQELLRGIKKMKIFIFSENFTYDTAIRCAAKASYLAMALKRNVATINKFNSGINLTELSIENEHYRKLNKLKKSDGEAFYYWKLAIDLY